MQIMFESIRSGDGEGEVQSDGGGGGEDDGEGGDTPKVRSTVDKRVEKRAAHYSPKGSKKTKNFRDQDEMKAPSKNSATSHVVDHVKKRLLVCCIKSLRMGLKKGVMNTTMPHAL